MKLEVSDQGARQELISSEQSQTEAEDRYSCLLMSAASKQKQRATVRPDMDKTSPIASTEML